MKIELDMEPLVNASERLVEGWERYQRDIQDIQIRDGLIQRFEFTYETSHKMIKRYLELSSPSPSEVDRIAFGDLIRSANEVGLLLGNWSDWKNYREMRGKTSHTYDEGVALEVVRDIPKFMKEVQFLITQLNQRLK
ncbi:MAG: HI0074 family nucleotidyltransferase substrate-binding subunit [Candidatus Pacebacteria bacterium]|nr:HI0074 family nucleotidyltransferase substrate-binding subunit [Candidatus Paceibacterota bacterium]